MNLSEILKSITKGENPYNTLLATVKAVDEAARTCDVLPIDGSAEIFGVRLNALLEVEGDDKGEYNIPAVNSFVLVTLLDNANAFVSGFSMIDKKIGTIGKVVYSVDKNNGIDLDFDEGKVKIKISNDDIEIDTVGETKFNGGGNGGMVIAGQVASYFNELYTKLNNLILAYNSHIHLLTGQAGYIYVLRVQNLLQTRRIGRLMGQVQIGFRDCGVM